MWRILASHEEEEKEAVQQVEKRLEGLLFLGIKPRIEAEISGKRQCFDIRCRCPAFRFFEEVAGQIIVIQGEVPWKR